jgi:hypothetical protein
MVEFFFFKSLYIKYSLFLGTLSYVIIEQLLETMIPRYASILDKHIKSIKKWDFAIIHTVHHLLLTVILAKGYYTPYANGQPLQWLIDHIVCIINESTFDSLRKNITLLSKDSKHEELIEHNIDLHVEAIQGNKSLIRICFLTYDMTISVSANRQLFS